MYIKREIPFDASRKEEFIEVMLGLGYFMQITPDKENHIFRRRISQHKGDSTNFLQKLSPLTAVHVAFRNDKAILRAKCGKMLLLITVLNILMVIALSLAGIKLIGILFLAMLFFVLGNLAVMFWVHLNFDGMVSKTASKSTV